jgi:chlorite dismutase
MSTVSRRGPGRILSHVAVYALLPSYWGLDEEVRARVANAWRDALAAAAEGVHFYRTFGSRESSDVLVWSSMAAGTPDTPARFFESYGNLLRPFRRYFRLQHVLWGLTADSPYVRAAPERSIDPFTARTLRYLIAYPFAKTHDWYRMSVDERRTMMSDHIRVGRGYSGTDQLLLYSTGLQDHEFVVLYETDDLAAFSDLVRELRATEVRGYTLLDTPVHVGVYTSPDAPGLPWP